MMENEREAMPADKVSEQEPNVSPQGPETKVPEAASADLDVELSEGFNEKDAQAVREVFSDMAYKLGLRQELLAALAGGRIELHKGQNDKQLAAYSWGTEERKLILYERALRNEDGNEFPPDVLRDRLDYLMGHETSHAILNTGAVINMAGLYKAIEKGEYTDGLSSHVMDYINKTGIEHLERHFTCYQAQKYAKGKKTAQDQWTFANEVVAERYHEYLRSGGSEQDYISQRLAGLDLPSYIVAAFPDMKIEAIKDEGDVERFWTEVGQKFNIKLDGMEPEEAFKALSAEGMPLEALKKDIDFWYKTFSEALPPEAAEAKISEFLEAQNEQMAEDYEYLYNEEFVGDEYGGDWFEDTPNVGAMPNDVEGSTGEKKRKTVADALFDIAGWLAGLNSPPKK